MKKFLLFLSIGALVGLLVQEPDQIGLPRHPIRPLPSLDFARIPNRDKEPIARGLLAPWP